MQTFDFTILSLLYNVEEFFGRMIYSPKLLDVFCLLQLITPL